jgi:WD40 repeat protein
LSEVPTPSSPYKGLAAFEDSAVDALFFFGRDRDSQVIAANLMASRLTVLFGPTGVGKTSVLRAGVAYKLRQEAGVDVRVHSSWIGDPGEALADLAPRTGRDVYLMLDQFEEFFLYHEADRTFVQQLADVLRRPDLRVNVLIGIREDALALLDAFKSVIPNLLSNRLRLENLDRAAGEAAIRGPLQRYNELVPGERRVDVEADLVRAVLDEVAAGRVELGAVGRGVVTTPPDDDRIEAPYLQLVMSRLWEVEAGRGSKLLRRETLAELGGATRIVEDHLEHAMAVLSPRQKDAAAAMYNFLVTPSGSKIAHRTRDLAGYAEIGEQEAADVLRQLAAERIVRASAENGASTRYEIYHDVLADAVAGWGTRYRAERSVHNAERRRRRAFGVATAAVVGLVLVAAIALFAVIERSHSKADAQRARAGELAADATIQLRVDPQKSLRLALAAARLDPRPQQQTVLRAALIASRLRAVLPAGAPVEVALFEPDGKRLITGARDGKIRVYAADTHRLERVLDQHGAVTAATFSANGKLLLTAGLDGWARLWRTSDGMLLQRFSGGGPLRTVLLDPRGNIVVTLSRNGLIRAWRARDGRLMRAFHVRGKAIPKAAALDPRAQLLATVGQDRFARVYRLPSGKLLRRLAQNGFVRSVAFSPDGRIILTSGYEGRARLWSTRSGRMQRELRGPDGSALAEAVFSRDGKYVAAAGNDGTARVWETATGDAIGIAVGHAYQVTHVAFAPADKGVVSASSDGTVKVWSIEGRLLSLLSGHTAAVTSVSFSPDGRAVLTASEDGTARVWDPWSEPELPVAARVKGATSLAVTLGGREVVVGDGSPSIRVFHATRSGLGSVAERLGSVPPATVALSPDKDIKAVGSTDGTVRLVDAHTNKLLRPLVGHTGAITSVAFSPDGSRVLTASLDKDVRLWSVQSGKMLHLLRWHFGPVASAAFSPDGRWVVTAGPSTAGLGLASTGERVVFLRGGSKPLVGAVFAGVDGRLIVIARKDGTIRAWRCGLCGNTDDLIELASKRLGSR